MITPAWLKPIEWRGRTTWRQSVGSENQFFSIEPYSRNSRRSVSGVRYRNAPIILWLLVSAGVKRMIRIQGRVAGT